MLFLNSNLAFDQSNSTPTPCLWNLMGFVWYYRIFMDHYCIRFMSLKLLKKLRFRYMRDSSVHFKDIVTVDSYWQLRLCCWTKSPGGRARPDSTPSITLTQTPNTWHTNLSTGSTKTCLHSMAWLREIKGAGPGLSPPAEVLVLQQRLLGFLRRDKPKQLFTSLWHTVLILEHS